MIFVHVFYLGCEWPLLLLYSPLDCCDTFLTSPTDRNSDTTPSQTPSQKTNTLNPAHLPHPIPSPNPPLTPEPPPTTRFVIYFLYLSCHIYCNTERTHREYNTPRTVSSLGRGKNVKEKILIVMEKWINKRFDPFSSVEWRGSFNLYCWVHALVGRRGRRPSRLLQDSRHPRPI